MMEIFTSAPENLLPRTYLKTILHLYCKGLASFTLIFLYGADQASRAYRNPRN